MSEFRFLASVDAWWYVGAVLLAGLLAFGLYWRLAKLSTPTKVLLGALRFVGIFLLLFLLLNPLIRYVQNTTEKALVVLAVDNSLSVELSADPGELAKVPFFLDSLRAMYESKGTEVVVHTLGGVMGAGDSLAWNAKKTNLSAFLREIKANYEGRNLAEINLLSDGIINRGLSPELLALGLPVNTFGIGDTVPKTDLILSSVSYNRISHKGNKFPVLVRVQQNGFEPQPVEVRLSSGEKTVATKRVALPESGAEVEVSFLALAEQLGLQELRVSVAELPGEEISSNNSERFFVEVLEGQKKVLIAAPSPHPDIKALQYALSSQENFEVDVYLVGHNQKTQDDYDLVVFHQIPNASRLGSELLAKFPKEKNAQLFVAGLQSNYSELNQLQDVMTFHPRQSKLDQIVGTFNAQFKRFAYEGDHQSVLERLPPMQVVFGEMKMEGQAEAILFQQLGNLRTDKPLLAVSTSTEDRIGVLAGTGFWRWWQHEYAQNQNHDALTALVQRTAQYLMTVKDKRKFRFSPTKNEFSENEQVAFVAQCFNDIYEPVYNQSIAVSVIGDSGKSFAFDFVNSSVTGVLSAGSLPSGLYTYRAETKLNGETLSSKGQFSVSATVLEALNTTADFDLLRRLSTSSEGGFLAFPNRKKSLESSGFKPPKAIIRSFESIQDIVNLRWLFVLILAIFSVEWLFRKLKGVV